MDKMEDKLTKTHHGPLYYSYKKMLAMLTLFVVGTYTIIKIIFK